VSGFLGSGKTTLVRRLLEEAQREGWQSILDNFARHVVARHHAH
jgi:G3E family GTPase